MRTKGSSNIPEAQIAEHGDSNAKGIGFDSQGINELIKCILSMLWIKISAKCIHVNLANILK